jgi:HD superfamily phosphohydrolase
MSEDLQRLEFDIAFALALLSPREDYPLKLPKERKLEDAAEKILDACVDRESFSGSSCRIRTDLAEGADYQLKVGNDRLALFPGGYIIAGGSGVTVQLRDKELDRSYALKVPRISVLAYKSPAYLLLDEEHLRARMDAEFESFENERLISRLLSHENIAHHFFGGKREIPGVVVSAHEGHIPFSVSEWISGARPLHKYLIAEKPNVRKLLGLMNDAYSALAHAHAQRVVHWDIKSDNVLVSKDGVIKIIDFGNAKRLDSARDPGIQSTTTKGKYPQRKAFKSIDTGMDESRRFRITLPHPSWNHPYIDLWMMTQEWNRCLDISQFKEGDGESSADERRQMRSGLGLGTSMRSIEAMDCLRIIFDRILYPLSEEGFRLTSGADGEINCKGLYYRSAAEILGELARILPPFGAAEGIPELLVSLDEIVRLPVTGNSVFTKRVAAVIDSRIVQPSKLHYQLAQVRQVFPGATHTRFEHLLGTITTAAYFVRSLYLNNMNSFWRVSVDARDVRAVLLASILHDSGHLAFGHFIEEMDDLMHGLNHSDYIVFLLQRCISAIRRDRVKGDVAPDDRPDFDITDEETGELVEILRRYWCSDEASESASDDEVVILLERVLSLFSPVQMPQSSLQHLTRESTSNALRGILKTIVDGPMDADKLDYLRRDSLHSGVLFSNGIDLERFFESLRVCVNMTEKDVTWRPAIGVSEKGIAPAETIITARYHLFSIVYWHRTVRCITAILQRLLSEISLTLPPASWKLFIRELLKEFRRKDDRQALEWLRAKLESLELLGARLATGDRAKQPGLTLVDLVDELLERRQAHFRMAFELSYIGPAIPNGSEAVPAREELHKSLCSDIHPEERDRSPRVANVSRRKISDLRRELEGLFNAEIEAIVKQEFRLDTILLDVPEPGKDQIKGLIVDQRSKRSVRNRSRQIKTEPVAREDYVDIVTVSPIAATLSDVFKRWARKVRIFMTEKDLARLKELEFEAGDVSDLWERILVRKYNIDPDQPTLRL